MGQIISSISEEKFVTSPPATRLETAAKKVVDDCRKDFESIIDEGGSSNVHSESPTIPLNGDIEKPEIFHSRGPVFQVGFQPAAKKVNGKPLPDQGNQQRKEVCLLKDVAVNKKWKKKFVEDSSKINEAIVKAIVKAIVSQVHIDLAAKEGNGKPPVDQQRNEVGYSKDATLIWKKKKKKKEIVEEGLVNEPIIKCDKEKRDYSNVTKNKEIVENRCNNSKNGGKKKTVILQSSRARGPVPFNAPIDPLAHQKNKQRIEDSYHKVMATKKKNWRKKKKITIVKDNSKNGDKEKLVIFQLSRGPVLFNTHIDPLAHQKNKQRIEDSYHKVMATKKKNWRKKKKITIVKDNSKNGDKEKLVIFQLSRGPVLFNTHIDPAAKEGNENPLAHQKNKQRIEDDHNKVVATKMKNRRKKKKITIVKHNSKNEDKEKLVRPVLFNAHIDPAAKKGNENPLAHQKNKQKIEDDHNKVVATKMKNRRKKKKKITIVKHSSKSGDKEKPVIFQSSTGPVLSNAHIDPAAKEGNENPLAHQKNKQRMEDDHNKVVATKRKNRRKKKKITIVKHSSKSRDKEKPVIFQSSRGPVLFNAHNDPAAKEGNENSLAHQKKRQMKEDGHHKVVATKKKNWRRKKKINIVEDNSKNGEKEGNKNPLAHQKNKQRIEDDHYKDVVIKKNRKKKKKSRIVEDNRKNDVKDENSKPLTNQSDIVHKNETINKACTSMWMKKTIVEDSSKNEPIINPFNSTKNKVIHENKDKPVTIKKKGSVFVVRLAKDEAINKALIVQEEKSVIFQSLREPSAEKINNNNKPLADFSKERIKETNHHKESIGVENNDIVWLKHYNNKQKILMVGEGDFSFSASLAVAFGSSASNITATSFNKSGYLQCNYKNATENIKKLKDRGATVRHGVDATKMSNYSYWKGMKFDRIIYNFPFSGCPKSEPHQNPYEHLELVSGFLLNAKKMLEEDGQIHISHKTKKVHLDWNLKELAMKEGLLLVKEAKFNKGDYPGYETKQGYTRDKNFPCNPSSTYMFVSIPSPIGN